MLSSAAQQGSLVKARCAGCSPTRWYHPADLVKLYGDVPATNLESLMHCGACGARLCVDVTSPTAEERQAIRLRRLDKIWWVRRVSWREE